MTVNELIINNLGLATRIAKHKSKSLPRCVSFDEIQSAAFAGLTIAAHKYDGSSDFSTYAKRRIFGEILDYLRSLCWGGRHHEVKANSLEHDVPEVADQEDFEEFFEDVSKNLTTFDKKVVRMYFCEDLSMKKIAEILGLSSSRVYQLVQANLQKMRKGVSE